MPFQLKMNVREREVTKGIIQAKFSVNLANPDNPWEQLQNTPQLIYMSLNKNSVYCVMPRSSKLPTHVSEAEMSCGVF